MLDEGNNPNTTETPEAPPPEEKSNRTFWLIGGILGGLVILTLACMAVYFFYIAPRATVQRNATQTAVYLANAQVAQQMTSTYEAGLWTPTSPPATFTATLPLVALSSSTPVIVLSTATPTSTNNPATLSAMQTQLSFQLTTTGVAQATRLAGQGMPQTGFFEDIGLPGLVIIAAVLIAIIFLARRMRGAPAK